jgi:hypothetical protein
MISSNFPNLPRQQLLNDYRALHAHDARQTPIGSSYHHIHGFDGPFNFETVARRFKGQDGQSLMAEASHDADVNLRAGKKHLWSGIPALAVCMAGFLGGALGILAVSLPAFIFGTHHILKGTSELKTARDDQQFMQNIQSLSDPAAARQDGLRGA